MNVIPYARTLEQAPDSIEPGTVVIDRFECRFRYEVPALGRAYFIAVRGTTTLFLREMQYPLRVEEPDSAWAIIAHKIFLAICLYVTALIALKFLI